MRSYDFWWRFGQLWMVRSFCKIAKEHIWLPSPLHQGITYILNKKSTADGHLEYTLFDFWKSFKNSCRYLILIITLSPNGPNVEAEIFVWDVEVGVCLKFWPCSSLFIQFVDCFNVYLFNAIQAILWLHTSNVNTTWSGKGKKVVVDGDHNLVLELSPSRPRGQSPA